MRRASPFWAVAIAAGCLLSGPFAEASQPTAAQALGLRPVQTDVDYDKPSGDQVAACKVEAQTGGKSSGWVVYDADNQLLRRFLDTNADNKVDHWCYYKNGVEVYRDIDADFNGKAEHYRWFGSAGVRWGVDEDNDDRIDSWKMISAEEVTEELVAALRTKDQTRFQRLLLSDDELTKLGLSSSETEQIRDTLSAARRNFADLAGKQTVISSGTRWVHFGAGRPGVKPGKLDGSTQDVIFYNNVAAVVETNGQSAQVDVGALVQVGQRWRLLDLPQNLLGNRVAVAGWRPFRGGSMAAIESTGPPMAVEELLRSLEQIDKDLETASDPAQMTQLHQRRAAALKRLIDQERRVKERDVWIRQFADTLSLAVQSGGYPQGVAELLGLYQKLAQEPRSSEQAAYVKFRYLSAKYAYDLETKPEDQQSQIQQEWQANLRQFVADFPRSDDAGEALLQLGIAHEYAGQVKEAIQKYGQIVQDHSRSNVAAKAAGAKRRLESVGKVIEIRGRTLDDRSVALSAYKGRVVLVHYWATWCDVCKQDFPLLKELKAKYGKRGFEIIGVNLDSDRDDALRYLRTAQWPWIDLHEPGGLDSRLANEMGVLTLPTMFLIDQEGRLIDRDLHASKLKAELEKRLR